MTSPRKQTAGQFKAFAAAIDGWQQAKSRRWAHTSLRRVSPMCIMASMWVPEPSFTMAPSRITGTGALWKRFLSHASLKDIRCGFDP